MTNTARPIDKLEDAVLRVKTMDRIDEANGASLPYESPTMMIGVALEAINAGVEMMKRGEIEEGEKVLYESAFYFHLAGFFQAKEQK